MEKIVAIVVSLLVALVLLAAPALAQPPPPHEHALTVPGTGETVKVGPPRCRIGERLDTAFLNFHDNVHVGAPRDQGGLTLAPQFC